MKQTKISLFWKGLPRSDKITLIFLLLLFISTMLPVTITSFQRMDEGWEQVIIPILGGLLGVFLTTGVIVFIFYRNKGIIHTRMMLLVFTLIALASAVIISGVLYLLVRFEYLHYPRNFPIQLKAYQVSSARH